MLDVLSFNKPRSEYIIQKAVYFLAVKQNNKSCRSHRECIVTRDEARRRRKSPPTGADGK